MEQELDMFERAISEFSRYVAQVEPKQWDGPTPDTGWTVRDLVQHMVEAVLWVPDLLAGKTIAQVGDKYSGDILKDDPKAAWDSAADKALTAIRAMTDLDTTVHLSYGDFPARTYLQHQIIDLAIHTWDLARAVGADEVLDVTLVQAAYEWLVPQISDWREAGIMAPPVHVPTDADTQDKLIALSGRNPA